VCYGIGLYLDIGAYIISCLVLPPSIRKLYLYYELLVEKLFLLLTITFVNPIGNYAFLLLLRCLSTLFILRDSLLLYIER
jgi:hypothetical protein